MVNLLSVLSVFRRAKKGSFRKVSCSLSDKRLSTEDIWSLISCLLIERRDLLDGVYEKVTFLRGCNYTKLFISWLTTLNESMLSGEHEGFTDLQTKIMVVKVFTIELHRKVIANYTNSDFFDQFPSSLNGSLMRGEYQAMVDSIRECLPLQNRMNGDYVMLERHPLRHEHVNGIN